jgi:1,4-alpha-glucan branching enzyme
MHENTRSKNMKKRISFRFHNTEACRVFLAGSFNAWDPTEHPLKKDGNGLWKTTKTLDQGIYQYRFIVDGEWKVDPSFRGEET